LIRLVCPHLFQGDSDAAVILQRLDEMRHRGFRDEDRERAAAGADQPPRYAVSSGHEVRVAGAGESGAGALLKKADDFSWNHNDACLSSLQRIAPRGIQSTMSIDALGLHLPNVAIFT